MIGRASTPFLALQGERTAQNGFKMVCRVVLGGNLSRVSWQDGFPPDNPNMGAFAKGIHARFINGANMHKALRLKVRKAKAIERKIQELAFNGKSEARRERAKMIENRHWYDREQKGDFRTGNGREHGRVTILD